MSSIETFLGCIFCFHLSVFDRYKFHNLKLQITVTAFGTLGSDNFVTLKFFYFKFGFYDISCSLIIFFSE